MAQNENTPLAEDTQQRSAGHIQRPAESLIFPQSPPPILRPAPGIELQTENFIEGPITSLSGKLRSKFEIEADRAANALRRSGLVLVAVSLAVLTWAGWETIGSSKVAEGQQRQLQEQFALLNQSPSGSSIVEDFSELSSPAVYNFETDIDVPQSGFIGQSPIPVEAPEYGEIVGRITIPSINVDYIVTSGTDTDALSKGPGLWEAGVAPGSIGNATIAGHRTTYGAPFRNIDQLTPGALIYFENQTGGRSTYEVRGTQIVDPSNILVTSQGEGVRLTLTSCHPVGSAAQRIIVQAELIEGKHSDVAVGATEWLFRGI